MKQRYRGGSIFFADRRSFIRISGNTLRDNILFQKDHSKACLWKAGWNTVFDRAKLAVPEEIGMSYNGYTKVSSTIVNLIMALRYKRDDYAACAKKCAAECLDRRQTISERSILCFLLALCDQNSTEASEQFAGICRGTGKNKEPYTTPV